MKVSDMQSSVAINNGVISGTLKKLTSGSLAQHWGNGYFLALNFDDIGSGYTVKVGLDPSVSSGLVELDSDHNGAFKITDPLNQVFVVEYTDGTYTRRDTYGLSGLVFSS